MHSRVGSRMQLPLHEAGQVIKADTLMSDLAAGHTGLYEMFCLGVLSGFMSPHLFLRSFNCSFHVSFISFAQTVLRGVG